MLVTDSDVGVGVGGGGSRPQRALCLTVESILKWPARRRHRIPQVEGLGHARPPSASDAPRKPSLPPVRLSSQP